MHPGPVVKPSKVSLLAFVGGVLVWMAAWLLVQELGGLRSIGPVTVFSLMTLPAFLAPAAAWTLRAPPGRRGGRLVATALGAALVLAAPALFGLFR